MEILDKRALSGDKPAPREVHGTIEGFVPSGDYALIRRCEAVEQEGAIYRPEAYVELAERGEVVAVARRIAEEVPLGVVAKFSKYGAEEIHFDDEGAARYALVRLGDIRGWHLAAV